MYRYIKRVLDVVFSLIFMVLLSPLFLILSLLIKLDSKGSIIYVQKRSGLNNKPFNLYKFRSMVYDNDITDLSCDDKLTKVGVFIRKTSLDELPQLFNILKGEMSFIGPRPWIISYSKYFTKKQMKRLDVLPGITGLAQANGRNCLSILDKIDYDLKYVNNYSFIMDINVIIKSVICIFKKSGIEAGKIYIANELDVLKNNYNMSKKRSKSLSKKSKSVNKKKELVKV